MQYRSVMVSQVRAHLSAVKLHVVNLLAPSCTSCGASTFPQKVLLQDKMTLASY